jgi:hypothetical protein
MIWLLTHPLIPLPADKTTEKERQLDDARGGGGGAKPYDGEIASSSINNSIFSELTNLIEIPLFWGLLLVHRDPDRLQLRHLLLHHPNISKPINHQSGYIRTEEPLYHMV